MIRVWAITALGRGCEESFEGDFSTISGDMRLRDLLFQHKQRRQCKREYLGRPEVSFNAFSQRFILSYHPRMTQPEQIEITAMKTC